ncbi:hypothetical protein LXA43DRAFT_348705 [Ganoderma leucocontextum]|nr:hypothetical protein LXA43DRAFT_348705 [Ganoderma leucocontextum]
MDTVRDARKALLPVPQKIEPLQTQAYFFPAHSESPYPLLGETRPLSPPLTPALTVIYHPRAAYTITSSGPADKILPHLHINHPGEFLVFCLALSFFHFAAARDPDCPRHAGARLNFPCRSSPRVHEAKTPNRCRHRRHARPQHRLASPSQHPEGELVAGDTMMNVPIALRTLLNLRTLYVMPQKGRAHAHACPWHPLRRSETDPELRFAKCPFHMS